MAFFSSAATPLSALSLFLLLFCVAPLLAPRAKFTLAGRPITPAAATGHGKSVDVDVRSAGHQLSVPGKRQLQTDQAANSGHKKPLRPEQTGSPASDKKQTECFGPLEGTPAALIPGGGIFVVGGGVPSPVVVGGGVPAVTTGGGVPAVTPGGGGVPVAGTGVIGGGVPAAGTGVIGGGVPVAGTGIVDGGAPAAGTGVIGGGVPAAGTGVIGGGVPAASRGPMYLPGNDDTFVPNPGFEVPNPAYGGATP